MTQSWLSETWQKYRTPIVLLVLVVALAVVFHHVLLPFFVALFIAFLIEPVVKRVSAVGFRGHSIPRWAAVFSVYAGIIGVLTLFTVIVAPQLGREFSGLATDAPEFFRELRDDKLPALSRRIDSLMDRVSPTPMTDAPVIEAQGALYDSIDEAAIDALVRAGMTPGERAMFESGATTVQVDNLLELEQNVLLRLRTDSTGEVSVILATDYLTISPNEDGSFAVSARPPDEEVVPSGGIDLVKALDEALTSAVDYSGAKVSEYVAFGQKLISKILAAFLSIIVTFMVAAFVSIDVPGIQRFIRSLFPTSSQAGVTALLADLNRGLSGVIRGQLLICVVNGVLTGLGLFIFKVKFAFVLGVLAGVFSLIPVFGTIISTVPCVLIGLTQSFSTGLLVLVWILVIHFLEANVLNPKIIGTTAEIHPAIIIFALLAGEHTYGLIGALLAVPVASIIQTVFLFLRAHWADDEAGDDDPDGSGSESDPADSPPSAERLLAQGTSS